MLDDRKLEVLRAIVEDYVSTQEPVSSKAVVQGRNLGVSPATIRNDMGILEEEGYIHQPHTSAGRVPTDRGYRLFVDRLSGVKPLSAAERRAIVTFLDGAVDLDDVVNRTVRLLAQLTHQVAVVQYPSLTRSTVRHIDVFALVATRVMLVVITDTGRVEQRVIEFPSSVSEELLTKLRDCLNSRLAGQRLPEAPGLVDEVPELFPADERPLVCRVLSVLLETLVEGNEERVILSGTANLARFGADFPHSIRPVLEALEEHVVLLRLLGETTSPAMLTVRIGHENSCKGLTATSVVSTGYGAGDEAIAKLGVLGPTRMDYPGTMGAVRAVAGYIGQILAES